MLNTIMTIHNLQAYGHMAGCYKPETETIRYDFEILSVMQSDDYLLGSTHKRSLCILPVTLQISTSL